MSALPFFIGLRYSLSRKQSHLVAFISRVSIAGMVLAVSLLILVTSVMNGFDHALKTHIIGIVPHVTLTDDSGVSDVDELIQTASTHANVKKAVPFSFASGMLVYHEKLKPVFLYSFDLEEEPHPALSTLLGSQGFKGFTSDNQIIVGKRLAQQLGVHAGDTLMFIGGGLQAEMAQPTMLEIIQLVETGTQLDQRIALTSLETLAQLQGFPEPLMANGLRLYLTDIFAAFETANDLRFELGLYQANDWTTSQGNLYQAVQMSRKMVIFLVFIIVAVAAFNLVSTLILTVNDKASDIAILRALGCSRWSILGIFMVQGSAIGVLGITLGTLIGLGLSTAISSLVQGIEWLTGVKFLNTDIYPVDYLPSQVDWQQVTVIALTAFLLSLLASIVPAIQASRTLPAKILRYE